MIVAHRLILDLHVTRLQHLSEAADVLALSKLQSHLLIKLFLPLINLTPQGTVMGVHGPESAFDLDLLSLSLFKLLVNFRYLV